MKKPTLKDIAARASVSSATVSYVLNNAANQSIPAETREKVLKIAEELGYVPNLAARSLVSRKSGLAGILISRESTRSVWRRHKFLEAANELEQLLSNSGYHTLLFSLRDDSYQIIAERKLDAVFLFDAAEEEFYAIANQFDVPLVLIDSMLDDPLFHKILPSYKEAIRQAEGLLNQEDRFLVMEQFRNKALQEEISRLSGLKERDICIIEEEEQLYSFLSKNRHRKGIIINEFLGAMAINHFPPEQLAVICTAGNENLLHRDAAAVTFSQSIASAACERMLNLLNSHWPAESEKYVWIKPT